MEKPSTSTCYGTSLRKPIRHRRIPVVKAAAEVLKEDERGSAFRAEAPVCVADPISVDEAGWSRDVGVFRHIYLRVSSTFRWHAGDQTGFPLGIDRSAEALASG